MESDTPETPLLTIVSVTFRDPEGIRATLESLTDLARQAAVEVIVVDGSCDVDTRRVVEKYSWARLIAEPDRGIYDGMNRGVQAANGRFVWFLNGGDSAWFDGIGPDGLVSLLGSSDARMHFFGYSIYSIRGTIARNARPHWYLHHALPTSHQAIIYPRAAVLACGGYDLSYTVSADYALTAQLWHRGTRASRHSARIANFALGGTSTVMASQIALDAVRVQRDVLRSPWPSRLLSFLTHRASRAFRERRYLKAR